MARPRNERRTILAHMKSMHRLLLEMIRDWDLSMTVSVQERTPDGRATATERKRRDDEKPENQLQAWQEIAKQAGWLRNEATALETFAQNKVQEHMRLNAFAEVENDAAQVLEAVTSCKP